MVDIDSETLFGWAAAIISTVAVLVFVLNVDFGHSPVSKTLLVVAFLAGVFAITQRANDSQLVALGYGVVVTSAVALLFDAVETFRVEDSLTVLALLALAGLLFALRRRFDRGGHLVDGTAATYAFYALAVLAALVLVVDVATGGLAYELRTETEIQYEGSRYESGQARIGSVVATNPTPLPERVDVPRYEACTAGNWSAYRMPTEADEPERPVRADLYVESGYNDHVFGYGSKTYPVLVRFNGAEARGETFPVRTTSTCPDEETGSPYVAVFEAENDHRYWYAV